MSNQPERQPQDPPHQQEGQQANSPPQDLYYQRQPYDYYPYERRDPYYIPNDPRQPPLRPDPRYENPGARPYPPQGYYDQRYLPQNPTSQGRPYAPSYPPQGHDPRIPPQDIYPQGRPYPPQDYYYDPRSPDPYARQPPRGQPDPYYRSQPDPYSRQPQRPRDPRDLYTDQQGRPLYENPQNARPFDWDESQIKPEPVFDWEFKRGGEVAAPIDWDYQPPDQPKEEDIHLDDRNMQIIPRKTTSAVDPKQIPDLPDSFYQPNKADLIAERRGLSRTTFATSTKKTKEYTDARVRFSFDKIPDFTVEGTFLVKERVSHLYDFLENSVFAEGVQFKILQPYPPSPIKRMTQETLQDLKLYGKVMLNVVIQNEPKVRPEIGKKNEAPPPAE